MAMNLGSFATRSVATIIVATDGTGDFTDIQTAIDNAPTSGATIWIKTGSYSATSLTLKSNITLRGDGLGTSITLSGTTAITIASVIWVSIQNLRFYFTTDGDSTAPIDVYNSIGIYFRDVWFVKSAASSHAAPRGFFYKSGIGSVGTIHFDNCAFQNTGTGNVTTVFLVPMNYLRFRSCHIDTLDLFSDGLGFDVYDAIIQGNYNCQIISDSFRCAIISNNYVAGDIQLTTPSAGADGHTNIIIGNYCTGTITIAAGCDDNVIIGNQINTALTDLGAGNEIGHNKTY